MKFVNDWLQVKQWMKREIVRSQEARNDVLRDAYYLAEKVSLNASDRYLQSVERAYRQLAEAPGLGALRDFGNPRFAGMRMWRVPKFPKYLIFYQAAEDELIILRVLHGARDLEAIFSVQEGEK